MSGVTPGISCRHSHYNELKKAKQEMPCRQQNSEKSDVDNAGRYYCAPKEPCNSYKVTILTVKHGGLTTDFELAVAEVG
jgi:hypothetical protein